ncbi:hypothetical protein RJT34_04796 [Clitoria ternatea]|uniref:Uncharacterized protein n=1 Tax=Clitoria ternatea TaxID=43366 RepID=A0AAN9KP85_CLITE
MFLSLQEAGNDVVSTVAIGIVDEITNGVASLITTPIVMENKEEEKLLFFRVVPALLVLRQQTFIPSEDDETHQSLIGHATSERLCKVNFQPPTSGHSSVLKFPDFLPSSSSSSSSSSSILKSMN